jgi:hypothetical protein
VITDFISILGKNLPLQRKIYQTSLPVQSYTARIYPLSDVRTTEKFIPCDFEPALYGLSFGTGTCVRTYSTQYLLRQW